MMKFKSFILLAIFVLAYFLRVMFLPQKSLTFGYDQARDAIISTSISRGDIKILGPSASTPGLYHGVLYYYVLAPAYALSKSPIVAAYWIALLNALVVFLVYKLGVLLTKKQAPAILASFLFAISFELTQYAVWLSNPTIAVVTVPLMYAGLWLWLKEEKNYGVVLAAVGLGFSVQAEIFLLYHAVILFAWILICRKSVKLSQIGLFFLFLIISVSTMILSEVKFGFRSIGGFSQLIASTDPIGYTKSLGDTLVLYLNQIGRVMAYSTYPGNVTYGSAIVLGLLLYSLYYWKKQRGLTWQPFLATWIFSHATVVSVGGVSTPFLLVGIAPAVCLLMGIAIYNLWQKNNKAICMGLLGMIIFGNLSMIMKENPKGQTIFSIQKDMLLSKQLQAIDYTYQGNDKFSINSVTSPLWINIVWTYLYKWHGVSKYGYEPYWHGKDQIGQLDSLVFEKNVTNNYYLIIEPMAGIPMRYLDETIGEEDAKSTLVEEKYFGELRIQKREKI